MNADMRTPRAAQQVADCRHVAALYVDPRGPYPALARGEYLDLWPAGVGPTGTPREIECWDETRDARKYDGPHPVVAHPPCGPWSKPHMCSEKTLADTRDCGPRAVEQVRAFGGVLEQPAGSKLWTYCLIPHPGSPDILGHGYTVEVDQCEWGHVARKRTWLYLVGVPRDALEAPPFPGRAPTHWVSGGRNQMRKNGKQGGGVVPPGIKVCSAQQRRRTPPLFAEYLVRLARAAVKP